jgi:hypothetical protein
MVNAFLESAVQVRVVLDRDYRDDDAVRDVIERLHNVGVHGHVWARHELENYLLEPGAIARISGAPIAWVRAALADVADSFEDEVRQGVERARLDWGRRRETETDSRRRARSLFRRSWMDVASRPFLCPGKEMISRLNERLAAEGVGTISSRRLSRRIHAGDIPQEMTDLILAIDQSATERSAVMLR